MTDPNLPSDEVIRSKMEALMKTVDLETMSTKQFIRVLSSEFGGIDLSSKKRFIKETITDIIDAMDQADAVEESEEEEGMDDDDDDDEVEVEVKPKKKRASGGGGLQAVKEISDELAEFLNSEKHLARTAVVKGLWEYIKEHNLQNPEDKREILLDAKMQSLFGTDRFDMFQMNKYVSTHIHPYPPLDLTPGTKTKRKARDDGKRKAKKKKDPVKRQSGTQAPYRLSDELAAVCGKNILPRPQVTQALWSYIRANNLQVR